MISSYHAFVEYEYGKQVLFVDKVIALTNAANYLSSKHITYVVE